MSGVAWRVVRSETDPELYAVRGLYLVADKLPIEDARLIAGAPSNELALRRIAGYPQSARITSDEHADRETMINIARQALADTPTQVNEGDR